MMLRGCMQFDKEVNRCVKLLEELDSVVARKKDVSQQVGWSVLNWALKCLCYGGW